MNYTDYNLKTFVSNFNFKRVLFKSKLLVKFKLFI